MTNVNFRINKTECKLMRQIVVKVSEHCLTLTIYYIMYTFYQEKQIQLNIALIECLGSFKSRIESQLSRKADN